MVYQKLKEFFPQMPDFQKRSTTVARSPASVADTTKESFSERERERERKATLASLAQRNSTEVSNGQVIRYRPICFVKSYKNYTHKAILPRASSKEDLFQSGKYFRV
jgi:hypothetical protein